MQVDIGFKDTDPDFWFSATMWDDDLQTLHDLLLAKEERDGTDFHVLKTDNGGSITIDLSEVLYVNTIPYDEGEDTNIEVEYIYGED